MPTRSMPSPAAGYRAFRELERRLIRRRIAQIDLRLRLELLLLALLIGGFLFWQIRVPLDGLARRGGPLAVLEAAAIAGVVLAAIGVIAVLVRHARRLRSGGPGPEWLALPVTPAALARHLAWGSRGHAPWVALPAAGVLVACVGLVPAWWVVGLAVIFAVLLEFAGRIGAALGERLALRAIRPRPGFPPLLAALASAAPATVRPHLPSPRWRRSPSWLALWSKDLLVTLRVPALRRSAIAAFALVLLSGLAWSLPFESDLRRFAAFALVLVSAAAIAEWLVAVAGSDPFATLRTLPIGVGTVWGARFTWAALATAALLLVHALTARDLSADALRLFLAWSGAAALGIGALGVNYGVTLFPRTDVAQRLLALSLGLAVAASIMLPLSGWVVLLSAILHSARRLPRWSRLEEA